MQNLLVKSQKQEGAGYSVSDCKGGGGVRKLMPSVCFEEKVAPLCIISGMGMACFLHICTVLGTL
jgi:hypothetical protein